MFQFISKSCGFVGSLILLLMAAALLFAQTPPTTGLSTVIRGKGPNSRRHPARRVRAVPREQ